QQAIAAAVKMSPKSSGFKIKLADLVQYGLLDGRGSFKATDLAQRLVVGDKTAYNDMMEKIPLFKSIYENLAGQEAPSDITPYLMTITKCERIDADKKKGKIGNIYNSLLHKISNAGGNMPDSLIPVIGQQKGTVTSAGKSEPDLPDFKSGEIKIFMPQTEHAWKTLLTMLPNIKFQITQQKIIPKEQKKIDDSDSEEDD
ncbi:MAG: hypothetical protein ABIH90_00250, partial [Candidatus Aenigmatarchaeota archaeon]